MNFFVRLGVLAALAGLVQTAKLSAQTLIQIDFTGGIFTDAGGTPFANGGLLQLVASTSDASFASPTAISFVGGSADDRVIATFAVDSTIFNEPGTVGISLSVNANNFPGLTQNDPILLRWFNLDSNASAPGLGTSYGEFRTDLSVDGGDPWVFPGAGGAITLSFVTTSFGGSQDDSLGHASFTVTAIPEPSATAWLGGLVALGLAGFMRGLKRQAVRGG